jgi:hypothetical protein
VSPSPAEIVLYSRPGCHLCEDTRAVLDALLVDRAALGLASPPVVERSIEEDDELLRRYLLVIPVVAVGDRVLELATKPAALRRFLSEALDAAPVDASPG